MYNIKIHDRDLEWLKSFSSGELFTFVKNYYRQ